MSGLPTRAAGWMVDVVLPAGRDCRLPMVSGCRPDPTRLTTVVVGWRASCGGVTLGESGQLGLKGVQDGIGCRQKLIWEQADKVGAVGIQSASGKLRFFLGHAPAPSSSSLIHEAG